MRRLATELGIEPLAARVLVSRGLGDPATAAAFLAHGLGELPDPFLMKGMDVAVERLTRAIVGGEKITLYGDYDVDGVCSTALLSLFLEAVGNIAGDVHPPPHRGGLRAQPPRGGAHRHRRHAGSWSRSTAASPAWPRSPGRGRWAWTWWWWTTMRCPTTLPAGHRGAQSAPAGLRLSHPHPLRRGGGLQSDHGAAPRLRAPGPLRAAARAGAQAVPRSGGPGHRGRRRAAGGRQPGAGEARAGGARARQSGQACRR